MLGQIFFSLCYWSKLKQRWVDIVVADMVADMVAAMEVDKVADMVADVQNQVYQAWNVLKWCV